MRTSYWSSDVCSSYLLLYLHRLLRFQLTAVVHVQPVAVIIMPGDVQGNRIDARKRLRLCIAALDVKIPDAVRRRSQELVGPALKLVQGRKRRLEGCERNAIVRAQHLIAPADGEKIGRAHV